MTVKTEGRHAAEFLLSEAAGNRSRDNVTVKQGQKLVAGQAFQLDGNGKAVALTGTLDSQGDLATPAAGIVLYGVDASATGSNADTPASAIARDAEVNDNLLTYPTESSAGGEKAATVASLKALGIIVR